MPDTFRQVTACAGLRALHQASQAAQEASGQDHANNIRSWSHPGPRRTCSALNVFFFISISAAGLSPQRSATRIICSRCLPSSLGVSGLCFSGKKILNTVLNLSIRLLRWLPSSLTRRATRRATSWLAEVAAAAARLVEPRGEEESPGVLREERGRGPRRGGRLGRRPGLVRLGVACGGIGWGDRMRGKALGGGFLANGGETTSRA